MAKKKRGSNAKAAENKDRKISGGSGSGEPADSVSWQPASDTKSKMSKARGRKNQKNKAVAENDAHPSHQSVSNGNIPHQGQDPAAAAAAAEFQQHSHRPHNPWVVFLFKWLAYAFIGMYFVVPAVIKLNPWIIREAVFLNRFSWPPSVDLSNPKELGMSCTRNFYLTTESDPEIVVGAWHMLPRSISHCYPVSEAYFVDSLDKGTPIILYLHGNAGTRASKHRRMLYELLSNSGYHVIALDYRGYGDSTGSPTEDGIVHDALTMYRWIRKHSPVVSVYLWGHSLGSGVATKLARHLSIINEPPTGLILEAPFTNLKDGAKTHPLSAPFRIMPYFTWVFLDGFQHTNVTFNNDQFIVDVTCPILILHARDDGIVPFELGHKLYKVALRSRPTKQDSIKFIEFHSSHGYGHKHIHKAPELPHIIWNFTNTNYIEEPRPENVQQMGDE